MEPATRGMETAWIEGNRSIDFSRCSGGLSPDHTPTKVYAAVRGV